MYKFANLKIVSSLFPNKVFTWTVQLHAIVDDTGHAQKGGAGSVVEKHNIINLTGASKMSKKTKICVYTG